MGFKNFTKCFFTCYKFNMIWKFISELGSWCSERFLSIHCCVTFWYRSKVNSTQIGAFSLVYSFGSDHLDTLVLFHSVLWMCEIGSCTVTWNVQEASEAGTKLVLNVPFCMSPNVQHSSAFAVGSLSEIGDII